MEKKLECHLLDLLAYYEFIKVDPVKITNVLEKVVQDSHLKQLQEYKKLLEQTEADNKLMGGGDSWVAQGDSDIPPAA